ncbi:hypothetical protein ACF0H5_022219 [Mactra antiquata]
MRLVITGGTPLRFKQFSSLGMASESKKRRRSSLAASKIREDHLSPPSVSGLYKFVRTDLAPEDRLRELSRLCLKSAIDTVCQEADNEDIKDSLSCVKDDLYKIVDTEQCKQVLSNAKNSSQKLLPNPANEQLDIMKEELEKRIERLKVQEDAWTEYLSDLDRQVDSAEKRNENFTVPESELTEEQRTLSEQYLPEFVDLDCIKQQVDMSLNKSYIWLCEHEKQIDIQTEMSRKADDQLNKLCAKLQEKSFPVQPDTVLGTLINLPHQ